MIEMVETYDGSIAKRKDCRFIKESFYIKHKQCFFIDGTWYRINCGLITYDHETHQWVITKNTPSLIKGIVNFDLDKNDVVFGYFTSDPFKNVNVKINDNVYTCIDYRILPMDIFKENPYDLTFVKNDVKILNKVPNIKFNTHGYPISLPYCCKHYSDDMLDRFKEILKKDYKFPITNIGSQYKNLNNYSFGFEFETAMGKIPNYLILDSGLMPLRDGSIEGIEFATIPLSGASGINILENACDMLKKYTTFTEQESLHLHIGNIPTSKKFVGYLYTLVCILENEVYSLFPKYYAQTSRFKARGKDYNMPLRKEFVTESAEETFDNLAFYLSSGKKYQGFGSNHPSDPDGQHKWGIQER